MKKKRGITAPRPLPPRPQRIPTPIVPLFRMFVLGSVAVIACAWAIWRYYTAPPMPMLRPVPSTSPTEHEVDLVPP